MLLRTVQACDGGAVALTRPDACARRRQTQPPQRPPHCTSRAALRSRRGRTRVCQVQARAAGFDAATASPQRPATSRPAAASPVDLQRLQGLLSDLAALVADSGPRGPARALQAVQIAATLAAEVATSTSSGTPPPQPPALLRRLFERLGATYIKLGQFIASSPTLFPEEYVLEFQKCLDKTPPVPFEDIRRIVETDLGQPLSAAFESVEPVPLATASVAQVHGAILRGSRKRVVIKVRKPGVEDALAADLAFMAASAKVLEFLAPELGRGSVAAIAGDLRSSMLDELDFRKEARNMASFRAFLENGNIRSCVAPFVYESLSSGRVLTMERLTGVALTDLDAIAGAAAAGGTSPEAVLINALNTWSLSVISCESFHADLHAGNLLVLPDGRVGFIDFGIVGRVSPATWVAVQALLEAASGGDWRTAAAALVTMGAADTNVDIDAFGTDLKGLAASLQSVQATLVVDSTSPGRPGVGVAVDETDITRLVLQLVRVGDAHGVKFPREFGLLLKQVLYFDRYQRALAPELDVLNDPRVQLRDRQRW